MSDFKTTKSIKERSSAILAIFNDIVNLKNAALELKKFKVNLWSISIGKPQLPTLEKVALPQDKVYAFFTFEESITEKGLKALQTVVEKYKGLTLENVIAIN